MLSLRTSVTWRRKFPCLLNDCEKEGAAFVTSPLDELDDEHGGGLAPDWRDEKRKREAAFEAALYGRS
jgi:hypothetical protein